MALVLLPDTERLLRAYLLQVSEVAALVGTAISTTQPSTPPASYVTITRISSPVSDAPDARDIARIQIDAWAPTQGEANLLSRTLRAALRMSKNFTQVGLGTLQGVSIVTDTQWIPDGTRTPPSPRYVLTCDVFARN